MPSVAHRQTNGKVAAWFAAAMAMEAAMPSLRWPGDDDPDDDPEGFGDAGRFCVRCGLLLPPGMLGAAWCHTCRWDKGARR